MPWYQHLLFFIGSLALGLIFLGQIFKSINDARALVSWPVTIIGSLVLVVVWIVIEVGLRVHGLRWADSEGQLVRVRRLRVGVRGPLCGFLVLLWIPHVFSPKTIEPPKETQEPPSTEHADTIDAKRELLGAIGDAGYRALVAEIIHAFEPNAYLSVAGEVLGPDGARSVDIQVWSAAGSSQGPTIVEVIDREDRRPVGIEAINIADSKRRDLKAQAVLISSNSGFDKAALRKAKRINVGLIYVLKQGDRRVKAKIEEEVYLRKVKVGPVRFEYQGASPSDVATLKKLSLGPHDVTYEGRLVSVWLQEHAMAAIVANPKVEDELVGRFHLKAPTEFLVQGHRVMLKTLSIYFHPRVQWLSQVVELDATAGIYDYIRGRVRLVGTGPNTYVIKGVNFDSATPLSTPPNIAELGVGRQRGEIDVALLLVTGFDIPAGSPAPQLNDLIKAEDLSLQVTGQGAEGRETR